ncbi:hypothetical protein KXW98_006371 [Aspergillus fumigatus]|uniref:Uncharacterized protein n=1 Tax=Aspergillus fumigatus (strain CBS 144.89 / FGSC A1163 / CEA10) TaxID=451804 RepID=B0XP12_ASPFC|nr:conserved hypothetical protein [Aspergillus fumigatus A1163]KAF4276881.1 hypothetical protein CNMCM8689_005343 [Aspergillus fumigatus]KAH1271064.1 hypothetical protein KXX30_005954 [Aspergillus fumigatus]KAH1301953.1 hypothetical protein KXX66_005106 [Aspergillus fumigatus]KAH1310966.1 hypothetical protein KXX47_005984 [Aspergillus fumigatus]
MPAIPPSPLRLSHRHSHSQSSNLDFDPISPGSYAPNGFSQSPTQSPRTPRSSAPPSPVEPRLRNAQAMNGSYRLSGDFGGPADAAGGLGNLADELADAWDEEDEGGYGYVSGQDNASGDLQGTTRSDGEDDYSMGPRSPLSSYAPGHASLQPPLVKARNGSQRNHRRHESQYDGSDYGNESDFEEAADIPPSLEGQMAEIESLVRRGIENNGSENDHVIKRVVETLRDLGSQSGIENNAMRLITAHTSITSHLTHQTRTLQTLTHPLLISPYPLLSPNAIDELIPLIDEGLLPHLPYPFPSQPRHSSRPTTPSQSPSLNPLVCLQTLIAQTTDLTLSLRGLSDTLYESRQLTATASRRLRSARELVAELRREEEGREEATRWIEKGDWDRRLRDREAGRVCRDVVSGFEAVCGEWRERLFGAAAVAAAGAEMAAA